MATFFKKKYSILAISLLLIACKGDEHLFTKGQTYFEKGEYELAIQSLKPLAARGFDPTQTNFLIAESYRLSNRIQFSGPYYEKAKAAGNLDKSIPFQMAFAAKANGDYSSEKSYLLEFIKSKPSKSQKTRAELELVQIDKIAEISKKKYPVEIQNLEGNTPMAEFAPRILDGDLIISASRKSEIYKNNGLPFLGLYRAKLSSPTIIMQPELFSSTIFQGNANEGTPAFTKDGNTMVFAKGNSGKNDISPDVDLYISKKENGNWSLPSLLSLSDSLAWDGSPTFSADGKTLYFASNRRGGKGGLDLYRANIDNSGRVGRAINLGSVINTPGDEIFPFVSEDGKLYFSSNGHPGLGGLDIFVATRDGNTIEVESLGNTINSISDDFGLIMSDENKGYFASNRAGGKGDDDIYYFVGKGNEDRWWSDEIIEKVKEENSPEKLVHYFVKAQFVDSKNKGLPKVKYRLRKNGETISNENSDSIGNLPILELSEGDELEILAEKDDFLTKTEKFSMEGRNIPVQLLTKAVTDTSYNWKILMEQPEVGKELTQLLQISPIYYDLDKSDIRADAAIELDKIVQFLKDNEQIYIELGSHTDSRATANYNMKLSQRRAESAVKYITSNGINGARIKAKGYGETQLINECADGVNCSEEMHQQNRRTEFVITEIKSE